MSAGIFSLQNFCSLSKLEVSIGSLIFDATVTKNLLNSLAISFGFSVTLSLVLRENMSALPFRLLAPISLNNFHTLAGLFAFSFKISEYWCFLDSLIILHTLFEAVSSCPNNKVKRANRSAFINSTAIVVRHRIMKG